MMSIPLQHYIIFTALFNGTIVDIPAKTLCIEELNALIGEWNEVHPLRLPYIKSESVHIPGKNIKDKELYESLFHASGIVEVFVPPKSLNPYFYLKFDLNNDNTPRPVRRLNCTKLIQEWIVAGHPKYWNPRHNSPLWNVCVRMCNAIDVMKNR